MKLSKQAIDFLQLINEDLENDPNRPSCSVRDTTNRPKATNVDSDPSSNPVEQTQDIQAGTRGRTTDYRKWEAFAKAVARDEEAEKNAQDATRAGMQSMLRGCAHDRSQERMLYEKPTIEKLLAAERFRDEGNQCFRAGNYELAAIYYRKALIQFDYTFPDTDEENERFNRSKLASHLNMAICKYKLQDWEESLSQCASAIRIDRNNSKALYRRGLVYLRLDKLEESKQALFAAQAACPTDTAIRNAIKDLNDKIIAYQAKTRLICHAMLSEKPDDTSETSVPVVPNH